MLVASVTSWITSFVGDHGVYAVFVLMLLDAVFPAASELVMVYAGALAAGAFADRQVVLAGWNVPSGWRAYFVMVAAGTIGYLFGSVIGWAVGDYGGRPLLDRRGRWFHLGPERLERAERWFDRWGSWAVLLGRITPVVRSFISIPAGVFRHAFGRYVVLTAAGSVIWCLVFAGVGWGAGAGYESFDKGFRYAEYGIVGVVVAGLALLVLRWRSSKLARRASDPTL